MPNPSMEALRPEAGSDGRPTPRIDIGRAGGGTGGGGGRSFTGGSTGGAGSLLMERDGESR